jgi:hypothetical protein
MMMMMMNRRGGRCLRVPPGDTLLLANAVLLLLLLLLLAGGWRARVISAGTLLVARDAVCAGQFAVALQNRVSYRTVGHAKGCGG